MRAIERIHRFRKVFLAASSLAVVLVLLWMAGVADGLAQSPAPEPDDDRRETDVFFFGSPGESAYLGVTVEEETDHDEGGARVTRVVDDSPAGEAGLQDGDIIVGFDGETIRGPVGLTRKIHAKKPGDRVTIVVLRDGKRQKLEADLGDRTDSWTVMVAPDMPEIDDEIFLKLEEGLAEHEEGLAELEQKLQSRMKIEQGLAEREYKLQFLHPCEEDDDEDCYLENRRYFVDWSSKPVLGVQLVEVTPELREHLGSSDGAGVLVSKVIQGTPAERAGIRVGDLIVSLDGDEISNSVDLRRALRNKSGESFDVEVIRDSTPVRIDVTIPAPDQDPPSGPRAYAMPAPQALPAPAAPLAVPARPRLPRPPAGASGTAPPAAPDGAANAAIEAERLVRAEAREIHRLARERARQAELLARVEAREIDRQARGDDSRVRAEALRAYEVRRGDTQAELERANRRALRAYERALRQHRRTREQQLKAPVLL